jgi:hypothetical protein
MIENLDDLKGGNMPTVSEKPWSDYTSSDYTPEQWHAACLLHQHQGAPTSKGQCKLPVKTPNGTLNRAGVHAAAAALAGARGGVIASPAEKASVAKKLLSLYAQLDDEPPPSLKHEQVDAFLAHYGVPGMKWGIRRNRDSSGSSDGSTESKTDADGGGQSSGGKSSDNSSAEVKLSADAERFVKTHQKQSHEMSDREIKEALQRARIVKEYNEIFNPGPNSELKTKVEAMRLKKEYSQLRAEMNPSKIDRVRKFAERATKAFEAYQALDKATGGKLSGKVNNAPTSAKKLFKVNPKKVKVANPAFKQPKKSPFNFSNKKKKTPVFKITDLLL